MAPETFFDRFARWMAEVPTDEGEAERELQALRAQAAEKRAAIDALEDELAEFQGRIETIEIALDLQRRIGAGISRRRVTITPVDDVDGAGEKPARGRDAIRALVQLYPPETEWTNASIVRELVKRDWADASDAHAVGVSLSRLASAGELERKRKGVYRLPSVSSNGQGGAVAEPLAGMEEQV